VELLEPAGPRACIRCCDDPDDCPVHMGQFASFILGAQQKLTNLPHDIVELRYGRMPKRYSGELL
jgi:hypothetical protein